MERWCRLFRAGVDKPDLPTCLHWIVEHGRFALICHGSLAPFITQASEAKHKELKHAFRHCSSHGGGRTDDAGELMPGYESTGQTLQHMIRVQYLGFHDSTSYLAPRTYKRHSSEEEEDLYANGKGYFWQCVNRFFSGK